MKAKSVGRGFRPLSGRFFYQDLRHGEQLMIVRAKVKPLYETMEHHFREYKFLSQTFEKQIVARLRLDVTPKNLATGPCQKQAQLIATPEGDQDVTAQQVHLLESDACGAFVHGLEDEYQDVRNAAISKISGSRLLFMVGLST
ncbi:MAG: hypothetical protein J3Q66DRAFT_361117 [Benniella sp.]|nr:MAG: hypothetical protein J3Q66DRAFT_361117 [Benniella sp.]